MRQVLGILYWLARPFLKFAFILFVAASGLVLPFKWIDPPITLPMALTYRQLGFVVFQWVPAEEVASVARLAAVGANDPGFCARAPYDVAGALDGSGGPSALSIAVARDLYLGTGDSFGRDKLAVAVALLIEGYWSKARILEVYLNVAPTGEGIYGLGAAAPYYFGRPPSQLTSAQAARLAVAMQEPLQRHPMRLQTGLGREASRLAVSASALRGSGAECFL